MAEPGHQHKLPRPSRCATCLFNKRGLLFIGLFTILVGMTSVVSSKIVWPVILRGISDEDIRASGAIQVFPEFPNQTIMTAPNFANWTDDHKHQEEHPQGAWAYFYWATYNQTEDLDLFSNNSWPPVHWILRNISSEGDITVYVRYSILPTLETTESGLFVGLKPIESSKFDTYEPPLVFGCSDRRIVFFGIYSEDGPKDFTLTWDTQLDGEPDYDGEIRGCRGQEQTSTPERLVRALYPVLASFFLFCGCICMAYWGYHKVTHPESELYQIVGNRPVELLNF